MQSFLSYPAIAIYIFLAVGALYGLSWALCVVTPPSIRILLVSCLSALLLFFSLFVFALPLAAILVYLLFLWMRFVHVLAKEPTQRASFPLCLLVSLPATLLGLALGIAQMFAANYPLANSAGKQSERLFLFIVLALMPTLWAYLHFSWMKRGRLLTRINRTH